MNFVENEGIKNKIAVKILIFHEHSYLWVFSLI